MGSALLRTQTVAPSRAWRMQGGSDPLFNGCPNPEQAHGCGRQAWAGSGVFLGTDGAGAHAMVRSLLLLGHSGLAAGKPGTPSVWPVSPTKQAKEEWWGAGGGEGRGAGTTAHPSTGCGTEGLPHLAAIRTGYICSKMNRRGPLSKMQQMFRWGGQGPFSARCDCTSLIGTQEAGPHVQW